MTATAVPQNRSERSRAFPIQNGHLSIRSSPSLHTAMAPLERIISLAARRLLGLSTSASVFSLCVSLCLSVSFALFASRRRLVFDAFRLRDCCRHLIFAAALRTLALVRGQVSVAHCLRRSLSLCRPFSLSPSLCVCLCVCVGRSVQQLEHRSVIRDVPEGNEPIVRQHFRPTTNRVVHAHLLRPMDPLCIERRLQYYEWTIRHSGLDLFSRALQVHRSHAGRLPPQASRCEPKTPLRDL